MPLLRVALRDAGKVIRLVAVALCRHNGLQGRKHRAAGERRFSPEVCTGTDGQYGNDRCPH